MSQNDTLTPARRRAIAALLTERDVRAAAKAAKISERTLWRWLNDANFQAALKEAEAEALSATIRRLSALTGAAVDTLRDAMGNADAPIGAKIRAADVTLARLLQFKGLVRAERLPPDFEILALLNDGRLTNADLVEALGKDEAQRYITAQVATSKI